MLVKNENDALLARHGHSFQDLDESMPLFQLYDATQHSQKMSIHSGIFINFLGQKPSSWIWQPQEKSGNKILVT